MIRLIPWLLALTSCTATPANAAGLTPPVLTGYYDRTAPHWADGLGSPDTQGAQPRNSGFFVRAVQSRPRYDGLHGDTFGCAGSLCRSANPMQSVTRCLAASGDGSNPYTRSAHNG